MHLPKYQRQELRFAYSNHAYLRWCTHRLRPFPDLEILDKSALDSLISPYGIHLLECETTSTEVRVLVSLQPQESISACASKLKGQTSKWLRNALKLEHAEDLLSKGYFACTSGKSTQDQVDQYLENQGAHHGYDQRVLSPVYVASFAPAQEVEARLMAAHAFCLLRFHLVLSTWRRQGVFGPVEAKEIAVAWKDMQVDKRFALLKVSFLPDHAHVAVRVHPTVAPGDLTVELMNSAQEILLGQFPNSLIGAGVERLWQPSAYVGSYGDLATAQIGAYLERCKKEMR